MNNFFVAGVSLLREGPDDPKVSNCDGIVDLLSDDLECIEALVNEGAKQRVLLHR